MKLRQTLLVMALTSGCALTGRGEPRDWTWFTPERDRPRLTSATVGAGPAIRIRRIASGTNLGKRIAFGNGAYEVGYYEQRRWTEAPESYVRRALERVLCREQGFRCELSGNEPTLDVEVLKFQEVKTATSHTALVELRLVLAADHVLVDDTVQIVDAVAGSTFDDVVAAVSRALDGAMEDIGRRVGAALERRSTRSVSMSRAPR